MNETIELAQPTRITTATVSVTLSHNSNYFKVELGIENELGLSLDEINDYRLKAHDLAEEAIQDNSVKVRADIQERRFGKKDNASIESIEKLPLWNEFKKRAVYQKSKNNGKA